ncbi:IF2 family translation initiation factor [Mycolicibacterium hippocampi]|uniref:IF2 family translation initiation factor n=1 Tax=Mycolicibacterium hippocampi TaxID=659824 RepID=UPI0035129C98
MNIVNMPVVILRLQYRIARLPLQLIEDRVMTRLDAETPARLFYERSLGSLDAAVGSVLGDVNLQASGSALVDRSDALARAARLDTAAEAKREKADAALKSDLTEAVEEQQEAHETRQQEAQQARREARKRADNAAEKATERTTALKQQAQAAATKKASAVEAARKDAHEAILANERVVVDGAKANLEAASDKRETAAAKRARADRVEELAETEKANRQAERAEN